MARSKAPTLRSRRAPPQGHEGASLRTGDVPRATEGTMCQETDGAPAGLPPLTRPVYLENFRAQEARTFSRLDRPEEGGGKGPSQGPVFLLLMLFSQTIATSDE